MIYTALALAVALAFTGCAANNNSPAASDASAQSAAAVGQAISPQDAKALLDSGEDVTLLDVRTQEEYNEAHIDGAILLPYDTITADSDGLPENKDATIIVYCRSGSRAASAAKTLAGLGYTRVYNLGGLGSWPYETVSSQP
jgi:rhodanese-related sulfurtransferase